MFSFFHELIDQLEELQDS